MSETFSELGAQRTTDASGGSQQLEIETPQFQASTDKRISSAVKNVVGTVTVRFKHKKNSETEFTVESTPIGNDMRFFVLVDEKWLDEFGMTYYFEAVDLTGKSVTTPQQSITTTASVILPVSFFGKSKHHFHIISFPYRISKTEVRTAFTQVMGDYDNKKWRFFRYENENNQEFTEGAASHDITQGEAYWFISANEKNLDFGRGESFGNSTAKPFKLQLEKGWNLIGNPFPFDLSWDKVLEANPAKQSSFGSELLVFNNEAAVLEPGDLLKTYGGGFVLADQAVEIEFPVTLDRNLTGRIGKKTDHEIVEGWFLPLEISQNGMVNNRGGIGMSIQASESKDIFDRVTPPRFISYVELNSYADAYNYPLTRNVVTTSDRYEWSCKAESNTGEAITLRWNHQLAGALNAALVLYDRSNKVVIDMTRSSEYSTTPSSNISIYYDRSQASSQEASPLNAPYPNPFQTDVVIPFDYEFDDTAREVRFEITDGMGRLVYTENVVAKGKLKSVKWDGKNIQGEHVPSGMYIYKIYESNSATVPVTGRVIKK